MGGLFSSPSPGPVEPPPPPPSRSDAEVRDAALKARQRRAKAVGRAETILTGSQGVTDEVNTPAKTLLGS